MNQNSKFIESKIRSDEVVLLKLQAWLNEDWGKQQPELFEYVFWKHSNTSL